MCFLNFNVYISTSMSLKIFKKNYSELIKML